MDHHAEEPYNIKFKVPYVCDKPYDDERQWLDFPSRQGIALQHLRYQNFQKYAPAHLASVLQNWLCFGLLKALLPFEVSEKSFLYADSTDTTLVTTLALRESLQTWYRTQNELSAEKKQAIFQQNKKTLDEARLMTLRLSDYPENGSLRITPFPPLPRLVALSCASIGETLELANMAIFDRGDKSGALGSVWSKASLLLEHMEIQGWCPFIVANLEHEPSISLKHYMASIGPPLVKRNHRSCSDYMCKCPEMKHKEIQHTAKPCKCSLHEINMTQLAAAIQHDRTPLVQFLLDEDTGHNGTRLVLGEADGSTQYVALSHVWSDGLGNEDGNSMPCCQLKRVQQAVNNLRAQISQEKPLPSPWFWIDTLCVPNAARYEALNARAVERMKEIYVNADAVLVIDSEVAACQKTAGPSEILARIRLSNWLRRLWTLQEGYFANSIHFLVETITVSLAQILNAAIYTEQQPPLDFIHASMWQGLIQTFRSLFHRSSGDRGQQFDARPTEGAVFHMLSAVSSRTSTKVTDEARCLAFLLNVDTRAVHQATQGQKMMKLLQLLDDSAGGLNPLDRPGCIPPGVIFFQGKRLDIDGFRWAPSSFLVGPNHHGILTNHPFQVPVEYPSDAMMIRPSGTLCKYGLKIMFPGLRIKNIRDEGRINEFFIIDTVNDASGDAGEVISGKPPHVWQAVYSKDVCDSSWESVAPTKSDGDSKAIIIGSYGPSWRTGLGGVLVKILHERKDRTLIVSRLCRMSIVGTPEHDVEHDWMRRPEQRVSGIWLPVHQVWCVD